MKPITCTLLALGLLIPIRAWGDEPPPAPEVSLDGLEQVEKTRRREVYAAPGADWSVFDSVIVEDVTVAFRKNWLRDQNRYQANRIKTSDMERIRADMARMFEDVFTSELTENGGYEIATEAGENVMRLSPQITELDVYAPDPRSAPGIQRSYAETAGRMTLKLQIYDSQTGDLVAVFSENREAPRRGYLQWANTVSNNQEFRIMLKSWARELRESLDGLRSQ